MTQLVIVLTVVFAFVLWLMYRRHHRQTMQDRAGFLSESHKVIDIKQSRLDKAGFHQVQGEFFEHPVTLKLEIDSLTPRKLPIIWLHVTMQRKTAGQESLDMLMRPQPGDIFSPGWNWHKTVLPPKHWPQHARYATQGRVPELQTIDSDVSTIFADQRAKELLIMPEYVRLTYLVRQADRGHYLLLRSADFDMTPIDPAEIGALLRQLQILMGHLEGIDYESAA
ncbi:MAG: hypothetical protein Kow0083_10500 [Methylophaga sp.]